MLENSYSIYRYIDILLLNIINLFYYKKEKKINFGLHLDKYKSDLLCFLKDLHTKKLFLPPFEKYLSKLDKYGIIFQVFQKSRLSSSKTIYYFLDLLKNENKAKVILNKIFSNTIILEINYNINLEELTQSIIESKCLNPLKNNECNFFDLYNTIQKKYEITEINNKARNENISTSKNNNRRKRKKHIK